MYVCKCNLRPENIYVSEIKYQKCQQNSEGNSTLECENAEKKISALARIFIDFSSMLVFCHILSFIVLYHILIKGNCVDCKYADIFKT